MGKRTFVDATAEARCQWNRTLRDGSPAQCGRRHIDGEFCAQHAKMAEANPDLTDEVVRRAAELVVESFPADDMAREELRDGLFDVEQMPPGAIFRVLVRTLRDGKQQGGEVQGELIAKKVGDYRVTVAEDTITVSHGRDVVFAYSAGDSEPIARQPVGQEAVVTYCGRRLTPEGTRDCWGVLAEGVEDLPRNTKLYAAPPAQGIDLSKFREPVMAARWEASNRRDDARQTGMPAAAERHAEKVAEYDRLLALIDSQRDDGAGVDRG